MSSAAAKRKKHLYSGHRTILIVGGDGRARNRHAIELGTHGYDVECSDSTEVALQEYAASPAALVLFVVDEHDGGAWDVYRTLARDYPRQPKGFALNGSQRLCSVSLGGAELMKAQSPDDLIPMVEELIGTARRKLHAGRNATSINSKRKIGATN